MRTGIDPTLKPPLLERFSDPRSTDFARRHRDVIARFGRFPHRNVNSQGAVGFGDQSSLC
ncbi:DUF924 family protein [Cyanobium sp. BA20m-p-22]|uniref:DUF924 family protein n=1 Tax=Cyanobium sp. BA20m-p-22 TaxID=2823704 RepID=UPI0020CD55EA|nr:DUF924 family protein [Cyanobium sp. BA20m-p-22]